jgi:hypothetical protein
LSFIGVVLGFAIIVAEIAVYFGVGAFIGWLNGRAKTHHNQNSAPAQFDVNNW